jgi:hypothetical protein
MKWPLTMACLAGAAALVSAAPQRAPRITTAATCAAELGEGLTTGRKFCDVVVASAPGESIAIRIPAHRGTARLVFDLHNRIAVPPEDRATPETFVSNTAIVAVLGPSGEIGRGAASSEFRRIADLFDRIGGGPDGAAKIVAPGPATPVSMTIPAGIASVGIVGVRLEVATRLGNQAYETPGRPIAIASDLRVEYTPR